MAEKFLYIQNKMCGHKVKDNQYFFLILCIFKACLKHSIVLCINLLDLKQLFLA